MENKKAKLIEKIAIKKGLECMIIDNKIAIQTAKYELTIYDNISYIQLIKLIA